MTRKVDAGGRPTLASYDGQGNVSQVVDRYGNGHFFRFNYDESRREYYAQIRYSSGRVREVCMTSTASEAGGRQRTDPAEDHEAGQQSVRRGCESEFLATWAVDDSTLIVTDEKGNTTRIERDERDNVTRITYPDDSSVSMTYELAFNQPTRVIDQRGTVYQYEHDARGNRTREVAAAGTTAERISTFTTMDRTTPVGHHRSRRQHRGRHGGLHVRRQRESRFARRCHGERRPIPRLRRGRKPPAPGRCAQQHLEFWV